MGSNAAAPLLIEEGELQPYLERANLLLTKAKWKPKRDIVERDKTSVGGWRESGIDGTQAEELSLVLSARTVSKDQLLIPEPINHTLLCVRKGLQLGMHIGMLFMKFSGIETLQTRNSRGELTDMEKTEFREKTATTAAITLFAAANYISWELSRYKTEEISSVVMDFKGIPELDLMSPVRATECMTYYLAAFISKTGQVNSERDFVKMALLYFRGIVSEVKNREGSLKHAEAFTERSYKLSGSDFVCNGFESAADAPVASVEFNRVRLDEIVGNRDAKHKARRLAERILCYDLATKQNPVQDLGGLSTVRMGSGRPGTGKSLQIAATATMLDDHCKVLGIPFLFWPMPDTLVSTFQGGSAERMMAWMTPLRDPSKIIYAPCDDAENNFEDRTRQGISAGVREVIGVFLRQTEGAYAVHHGNAVIELFTNLPEQLDKAVLSRIMERMLIEGAETHQDFLDQDHLWWRKFRTIDPKFVNMTDPRNYTFLEAQKPVRSLSQVYQGLTEPKEERIRMLFERAKRQYDPKGHDFFAHFFVLVRKEYPFFSSRDVRNIQSAVSERIMDFDLEPEWLEKPELFFKKDYDTKKAMLVELMKKNMHGLSFAEVRLQETIRYTDTLTTITSAQTERRLHELTEDLELRIEASKRVDDRAKKNASDGTSVTEKH